MATEREETEQLSPEEANARDLAKLKGAIEGDGEQPPDDGDDPEEYLVEEERPSRQERRRQRLPLMEERNELSREVEQLRQQVQQMARPAQPQQPQVSQADVDTWFRNENQRVQQSMYELAEYAKARQAAGALTQDEANRLMERQTELDLAKAQLISQHAQYSQAVVRQAAPPPMDPAVQVVFSRYADVRSNPRGNAHVNAYYHDQLAAGRADNLDLLEESLQYGRAQIEGKPFSRAQQNRPAPSASTRARYAGTSAGGGGGQRQAGGKNVTFMAPEEARLADKLYSHIPDVQQRRKKFIKEVRPKMETDSERKRA